MRFEYRPDGHEYNHCQYMTERATRHYPGAVCGELAHPLDEYCSDHGGRAADDPIEPEPDFVILDRPPVDRGL